MKFFSAFFILIAFSFFSRAQNLVTTYAGDGSNGFANGDTSNCKFKGLFGMCIDHSGNLYIADNADHRIRKISADGIVTTFAGTGVAGYLDGPDSVAKFNAPSDLCVDDAGNIYVSDFQNQYIRKISTDGMVSTIAGNGIAGYVDGTASQAEFNYPRGICIDASGNLFIADSWNHRIRKIDVNGNVSTLAGFSDTIGVQSPGAYADGSDTSARFNVPCGMSIDSSGNLYLADAYNHRIRKITPSGVVTTIAGSGPIGVNNGSFLDGDVSTALLNTPTEVFIDHEGRIWIGDTYNNRVRLVINNMVSTAAGNGIADYVDGIDTAASFDHPRGLVMDAAQSHIYVCDGFNDVIRKIWLDINTGIAEEVSSNELLLFPNPSAGKFFITTPHASTRFYITDIFGRQVFSDAITCTDSPCIINVERLPDGFYFLSLLSKDGISSSAKFLIHH